MSPFDPDNDPEFAAQTRRNLIEAGVPEANVDELMAMATEYGKAAAAAVEDFERRGGRVVYENSRGGDNNQFVIEWDSLGEPVQERYIKAFAAAVDFIDEETYDPEAED